MYDILKPIIFFLIFISSWTIFFFNIGRLILLTLKGKPEVRWTNIKERVKRVILDAFLQLQPLRYLNSGIKHFLIFWGFMLIGFETIEHWIRGIIPDFRFPILNTRLSFIFLPMIDTIQFLVMSAIFYSFIQRVVIRTKRLENTLDAFFILSLIFTLMFTSYITKSADAVIHEIPKTYTPFSSIFRKLVLASIFDPFIIKEVFWWWHILTVLFFLNYLPFSKHLHIITSIPNIFIRNLEGKCQVKPLDIEKLEKGEIEYYGVKTIRDFTWKQLFDFLACTECGRCTDNCPASITGKPLSPMHLVHKLKDALKHKKDDEEIVDGFITEEELWDCTTCAACEEICPVGIEHPRFIVDLRRYLVFNNKLSGTAAKTLQKVMNQGNPWGLPAEDRDKFAESIGLRILKDGEKAEFIYWIGCAGYFDPLGQKITKSVAKILKTAGIDIPVLGSKEVCTGDPARRIGEEGLFAMMAQQNISLLQEIGVKKILVHCPHCLQTIKNDYKGYGGKFEVIHHSQFILQLMKEGKIKVKKDGEIAVYHDSCYLGRYNGIYDEQREVLKSVFNLKEVKRSRERGMCCGAGGGKMWYEERGERVNYERFSQLLSVNPSRVVSACPFCLIMLTDANKFKGTEDKIKTQDIAEIIAEKLL